MRLDSLEIIWVGDSTSDKRRIRLIKKSPTAALYAQFKKIFLGKDKPLCGTKYKIFARAGATTQGFVEDSVKRSNFKGVSDVIHYCNNKARENQIIVYSLGHNDKISMSNWDGIVLSWHRQLIDRLLNETNAFLILRMPNAWVHVEGRASKEVYDGITRSLYNLYLELGRIYTNRCLMVNIQDELNWKGDENSKKYMKDWTHPNEHGYEAIADVIGNTIAKAINDKIIVFSDAV